VHVGGHGVPRLRGAEAEELDEDLHGEYRGGVPHQGGVASGGDGRQGVLHGFHV